MKILPLVKEIQSDIMSTGVRLKKSSTDGYNIASRAADIYKQGKLKKYINVTRSVSCKVAKSTTKKDLPYVAGALGMLVPLPLVSPILMGLGFLARFSITKANQLSKNADIKINLKA